MLRRLLRCDKSNGILIFCPLVEILLTTAARRTPGSAHRMHMGRRPRAPKGSSGRRASAWVHRPGGAGARRVEVPAEIGWAETPTMTLHRAGDVDCSGLSGAFPAP